MSSINWDSILSDLRRAKKSAATPREADILLKQAIKFTTKAARVTERLEEEPLPPELPDIQLPDLQRPEEFQWEVTPGKAKNTSTGRVLKSTNPVGAAYREQTSLHGGERRFTASLTGDCGLLQLAGGWSEYDQSCACWQKFDGTWGDVDMSLVGTDATAKLRVQVGGVETYGKVKRFAAHDLTLVGPSDSFVLRQQVEVGEFVLDGFTFEAHPEGHSGGLHFPGDWRRLILNKYRAENFTVPNHLFYVKGGGEIQAWENELDGANLTGLQVRAESDWFGSLPPTPRPHGIIVVANNTSKSPGKKEGSGGALVSLYSNPDYATYVGGNKFEDCYRGALYLIHRDDAYHDEDNFSHKTVRVENNVITGEHADRPLVSFSSIKRLDLGSNDMPEPILNDEWSKNQGAPDIKEIVRY